MLSVLLFFSFVYCALIDLIWQSYFTAVRLFSAISGERASDG
jgi:hypothetical protein